MLVTAATATTFVSVVGKVMGVTVFTLELTSFLLFIMGKQFIVNILNC
jgi:hypothetical protein